MCKAGTGRFRICRPTISELVTSTTGTVRRSTGTPGGPRQALTRLCRLRGEHRQQTAPAAFRVDCSADAGGVGAVAIEMPVFEIDARRAIGLASEPQFHLARFGEVGLVLPAAVDLPGDHQPMRRLPDEHRSPIAV